jgi:hypothetical protein
MWEWWGRLFSRGTPVDPEQYPDGSVEDLTWEERIEKLEERVKRLDERTRKQQYRERVADVPAAQVPNSSATQGRKVQLMRSFNASRQGGT